MSIRNNSLISPDRAAEDPNVEDVVALPQVELLADVDVVVVQVPQVEPIANVEDVAVEHQVPQVDPLTNVEVVVDQIPQVEPLARSEYNDDSLTHGDSAEIEATHPEPEDGETGDPDPIADTVSSSSSAKRRQEKAHTRNGTETGPAAKVAHLVNVKKETKAQGDEATESLTTERIMNLLKDLWSDDKCVIERALTEFANLGRRSNYSVRSDSLEENEVKIRVLGVHTAVFQVLQKHTGCLEIQAQGMRALGNFSRFVLTKKILGDIGCVEVILDNMNKHPESETIQLYGCFGIGNFVRGVNDIAERVKKYGGIALVIAAMKAYPDNEKLQECGCRALLNMSEWEEYRPLIVEAGGASAIASTMEKYRDHPKLREGAYNAMEKLTKRPRG
jgi:hypothetical protein